MKKKELVVLERTNGWYGGYEKRGRQYEQVFNTNDRCLFMDIKFYADKGYNIICLDKTQEAEFMKSRVTLDEYLKECKSNAKMAH